MRDVDFACFEIAPETQRGNVADAVFVVVRKTLGVDDCTKVAAVPLPTLKVALAANPPALDAVMLYVPGAAAGSVDREARPP